MSGSFPTGGDKRGKRMLPSVSDVVRELQGGSSSDPGLLFKAARQVCAEELARVKQGFEAAPLEVLVGRARVLLDPSLATTPSTDLGGLFDPQPAGAAQAPTQAIDDPFAETTGALDLKWEAESGGHSAGPSATEILPLGTTPALGAGPGDETLAGLEREAQRLSLTQAGSEAPWRGAEVPLATSHSAPAPEEAPAGSAPYEESRPMFTPPHSSSRSPVLFIVLALALFGVGFGAWKYFSGSALDKAKPAPLPSVARRKRPAVTPGAVSVAPETTGTAGTSPAAAPTAVPTALPAAARPTQAPAPAATAAPRPTQAPTQAPTRPPVATRPPSPAAAATRPPAPPTAAPARSAPAPSRPAAALRDARGGVPRAQPMRSPDWTGKAPVYVVHFTSYKERKPAALDAARLGEKLGRPGHAIQVDLGEKGVWFRAVVGEFATVEEAKAFREKLAAEKTPSLGLVYFLTAETQ